jgi:CBS domain-containing protein
VGPDETLEAARRRLASRDLSAVPVITASGQFAGTISRDRIARAAETHWLADAEPEG